MVKTTQKPIKTKEIFEKELKISNMNILGMAIFTLVNIFLIVCNIDSYFPFTASVPSYLVLFFSELCGMRGAEFYEAYYGADWQNLEFLPGGVFYAVVAIAVLMAGVYFALWYFSKKKKAFLTVLMVLYSIDAFGLLVFNTLVFAFDLSFVLELAFHAWVFYYLIRAMKAWDGLGYAPSEAELAAKNAPPTEFDETLFASEESAVAGETDGTAE